MDAGLARAINHFGPYALTDSEINALRCLRNAFVHDYALVSYGRRPYPNSSFIFTLAERSQPGFDADSRGSAPNVVVPHGFVDVGRRSRRRPFEVRPAMATTRYSGDSSGWQTRQPNMGY
jgi:hypothetical protein